MAAFSAQNGPGRQWEHRCGRITSVPGAALPFRSSRCIYIVMARMVRKQIYLTPEQAQRLRRAAARERRTEADVIREALDRRLGGAPARGEDDPLLGIIGFGSGGPADLSSRVDDYLYGEPPPPAVAREPTPRPRRPRRRSR
jgi:hypothetical protein